MVKVRTVFANNIFGAKFFEIIFENGKGEFYADKSISLTKLKELGVAKTMNSTKKVRDWANSKEGQEFLFAEVFGWTE